MMTAVTHLKTQRRHCPECGDDHLGTRLVTEALPYGEGHNAITLKVEIPVRHCSACGLDFTDASADEIRDAAIRRHLGLLLPEQIRGIRKSCGVNRKEFAAATRIGEASLARWESGHLLQSGALDNFLFLLLFRENYERLQTRHESNPVEPILRRIRPEKPVLRLIDSGSQSDLEKAARQFKLHA
jgi:putative zinc finger/helix-turn-helix YgiT family protein